MQTVVEYPSVIWGEHENHISRKRDWISYIGCSHHFSFFFQLIWWYCISFQFVNLIWKQSLNNLVKPLHYDKGMYTGAKISFIRICAESCFKIDHVCNSTSQRRIKSSRHQEDQYIGFMTNKKSILQEASFSTENGWF